MGYSHSHSDLGGFCRTILRVTLSSNPTKLCVRAESMIVDTLGGICKSTDLTFELKIFMFVPLEMFLALHTFPRMLKMTLALLILFFTSAAVPPSIFTMLPTLLLPSWYPLS